MSQPSIRLIYRIVTLLALGAFLLAPVGARPALADVAAPTILDNVEEWAVGAGLVYWAQTCFADEFNPIATLKRIPAGGGVQRTLESINNDASCRTYQALHSSGDGLYYFDDDENRIERMPLGEPYTPTGIANLSDIQAPSLRPALIEGGDFLYWLSPFGAIYRTAKAGGGPIETVATTGTQPNDLLLVGNTMYWSDSTGIWSISVNCESLPCNSSRTQFSNIEARAHGLLYQSLGGFNGAYRIYWVEAAQNGANITWSIRYQACNAITVCFVLPPPGQLSPPPPLLYTATTNWQIGDLALAAGNLYWTEADRSTINNSNGDVKRKPYNDANPGAQTIATGQANLDSRIFIAGASMFFARRNNGIYSLPLNASAIVRDFEVAGIEATQAIQNLANNAPLVAEKTTYVRGYARQVAGPSAPNVEARLVGLRNGNPLPGSPLQPVNGVRALSTGGSFDRSRLNDGWYFLLPASWISAGTIELRLEIDARQVHSDPNRSNNQISQNITFQEAPPICVWTVPVRTHTPLPSVYDPNFSTMIDHFKRRWPTPDVWVFRDVEPVEELELCSYYGLPYPCHGPYELSDGWGFGGLPDRDKVIVSLWTRALLSFNPDSCDDIGAPVHFMGMVHPAADNGGFAGYASTVSNQSWVQLPAHTPNPIAPGWNQIREGSVMAQELAHNYGRKHVDCGDPDDIDGNYPYPPCQIANVGAASYYGFDVTTLQPIRPNETADFMSYARRSWVSDYTWRGLLSSVQAASVSAKPQLLAQPGQAPGIFVSGVVDMENERGALSTILQLPGASLPPATVQLLSDQRAELDHGNTQHTYSLRLLGPNDAVLLERTLVVRPLDDHSAESANAVFSDLFAPPAGSVTTIQLLADGVVIDSLKPGAAAPQVTIQQPGAGVTISNTLTLRWTASDPDQADRLRYTVQYSHDAGASWHTVGLDLPGGPDPQVSLNLDDLGSLPGSAPNGARIRVLASDGYNTTIATSAAFTLADRLPEPAISAPYAGQSFAAGQAIVLRGTALDPEDGGLGGEALEWRINGVVHGSGADQIVQGLAPGNYTAQLSARDSGDQTATASVNFQIEPLSIPLASAPILDGGCDDSAYAAASAVALRAYADGNQATLRLLRSADQLWACFSGLQAARPARRHLSACAPTATTAARHWPRATTAASSSAKTARSLVVRATAQVGSTRRDLMGFRLRLRRIPPAGVPNYGSSEPCSAAGITCWA